MTLGAYLTWAGDPPSRGTTGWAEAGIMRVVFQASCMGLAFHAWEFSITLSDEVNLVWLCRPCSPTLKLVKFLFFFSRYIGLIVQSVNIVLAQKIVSYRSVPTLICRRWISYQIVVIFSFLSVVNLIINIRIYAIYRRSRKIAVLLAVIFFSRLVLATAVAILYIPRLEFDEICGFRIPWPIMAGFLIVEMVTQSFTLWLTFMRRTVSANRASSRLTLLYMLYRDAVLTYVAVFSALAAALVSGSVQSFQSRAQFVFPIFVSILSTSACRMVMNMQELALNNVPSRSAEFVEFTSVLEVLDSSEEQS